MSLQRPGTKLPVYDRCQLLRTDKHCSKQHSVGDLIAERGNEEPLRTCITNSLTQFRNCVGPKPDGQHRRHRRSHQQKTWTLIFKAKPSVTYIHILLQKLQQVADAAAKQLAPKHAAPMDTTKAEAAMAPAPGQGSPAPDPPAPATPQALGQQAAQRQRTTSQHQDCNRKRPRSLEALRLESVSCCTDTEGGQDCGSQDLACVDQDQPSEAESWTPQQHE